MGPSPSVLTVASTAPSDDAAYIQRIFSTKFRSEDTDNSNCTSVLVGDGVMIVLIRIVEEESKSRLSTKMPLPAVTLAVEEDEIKEIAERGGNLVRSFFLSKYFMATIHLPGGATIIMVPFGLISSPVGRKALSALLMQLSREFANSKDANLDGGTTLIDDSKTFKQSAEDAPTLDGKSPIFAAAQSKLSTAPELPKFPSLAVKLLENDGKLRPFPLNSREPVDFETELFKGKILVVARPKNPEIDDPYWNERLFSKRKRRLVINLQGSFKRKPQGVVYAGAEISDPMKLGLVTRGLCKVLLRLVESFNKNMHYSFGDSEGKELAHIVAPAYTFFERFIATPPGQTPPSMDEPFEESPESIAYRKKTNSFGEWNTTDTYSFSFYSMYIDLPTWQLVGLPASGDLSLTTFWGQSSLSIGMYEKTGVAVKQHCQKLNRYAFSLQLKFLGSQGRTSDEPLLDQEENNIILWSERHRSSRVVLHATSAKNNVNDRSDSQLFFDSSENDDELDLHFFDAEESQSRDDDIPTTDIQLADEPSVSTIPTELLATIDITCPFWIDTCSGSRCGWYAKAFAVNVGSKTTFRLEPACEDFLNSTPMDAVQRSIKDNFSIRMSSSEKFRRYLGFVLSRVPGQAGSVSSERLKTFRDMPSKLDSEILRRAKPTLTMSHVRKSGFVARALSDRHWVEEWAYVNERNIAFHHPEKRRAEFILPLPSILNAERLNPDLCPQVFGYHILVLTTLGRSVYLMFASELEINSWWDLINSLRVVARVDDADSISSFDTTQTLRLVEIDNAADEFLHKSSIWHCKNRRILNCGKFYFRQEAAATATNTNPLALAEVALKKAVTMSTEGLENSEQRRAFLDSAAELKLASVHGLDEDSRLAFFLNVYHIMISHAFLVLGAPNSSLQWISYFNNVAYQIGDDIFSLTELEHCIIRAQMSYPTQFLSRFVIPKKSTYRMELKRADFRINFALNCGSLSNPSKIIIYKADRLQEQLNAASCLYLKLVTYRRHGSGDLELKLPKICQWFADDFGTSREDLLASIEPFLPDDVRRQLTGCKLPRERRFDMSSCTIRYHAYNFECRPLSLI